MRRRGSCPCPPIASPGREKRRRSWSSAPGRGGDSGIGGASRSAGRAAAGTERRGSALDCPIRPPASVECVRMCTCSPFAGSIRGSMPRPPARPATVRAIARRFEADLGASILASGPRIPNVRQISERVAMGRALWRELVVGFASQLSELRLGFTQLAALYVLAEGSTTTIGELAEALGRSPSATSRLVDGLVKRRLVERREEPEDRRQRSIALTQRGQAILRVVDRARA